MNVNDLLNKLNEAGIPSNWYSINGDLSSDIYVLREVHDHWEFFYVDERGNQNNDYKRFSREADACEYFLSKHLHEKDLLK